MCVDPQLRADRQLLHTTQSQAGARTESQDTGARKDAPFLEEFRDMNLTDKGGKKYINSKCSNIIVILACFIV